MELKTILNKTVDAVKLILTQPTMIFRNTNSAKIVAEHVVREDDAVRPDLIALQYYGDSTKLDMILKFNGISDPFSINPGETLIIPDPDTAYYRLERPTSYEENPVKAQFIDTKRLSKKDQNRIKALKKKYNKETLLPPNVIPVGKKNYEFDGKEVRLGAQVQTDAVTESITAEIIAAANAEGTPVQTTDDTFNEIVEVGGSGISSGSGSGSGSGLTNTQLENLLNENSGVQGITSGTGAGKTDMADEVATNKGDGTSPANTNGIDDSGSAESPCDK